MTQTELLEKRASEAKVREEKVVLTEKASKFAKYDTETFKQLLEKEIRIGSITVKGNSLDIFQAILDNALDYYTDKKLEQLNKDTKVKASDNLGLK